MAYSLMGIFEIHIPLIYGEGEENAFTRLSDAIEKSSNKSKLFAARYPSPASDKGPNKQTKGSKQQSSQGDGNTRYSSSWLKPVVAMPSQDFKLNDQSIDPGTHSEIVDVIFSNCRVVCFEFHKTNELWRTQYDEWDKDNKPKLFQLDDGGSPECPADLPLRQSLVKIPTFRPLERFRCACYTGYSRLEGMGDLFRIMTRVCSLVNGYRELNTENFEECLLIGLPICRHLHGWVGSGRLKVLLEEFHKPYEDVGNGALNNINYNALKPSVEALGT